MQWKCCQVSEAGIGDGGFGGVLGVVFAYGSWPPHAQHFTHMQVIP